MTSDQLTLTILTEALASPLGVIVKTNNPARLSKAIAKVIQENGDTYTSLAIEPCRLFPTTQLWIVRNEKDTAKTHAVP